MRYDARSRLDTWGSRLRVRGSAALLAVALAALVVVSPASAALPTSSVSDKIICQCGCGAVLTNCPHQECGWGVPAKLFIAEQLAAGKTPDEMVQYYVSAYGEQVLSAPTKRGFNVTAWVTPFVGLVVGAVAIYFLAHLWAQRRQHAPDFAQESVEPVPLGIADLKKLEDELRGFD